VEMRRCQEKLKEMRTTKFPPTLVVTSVVWARITTRLKMRRGSCDAKPLWAALCEESGARQAGLHWVVNACVTLLVDNWSVGLWLHCESVLLPARSSLLL